QRHAGRADADRTARPSGPARGGFPRAGTAALRRRADPDRADPPGAGPVRARAAPDLRVDRGARGDGARTAGARRLRGRPAGLGRLGSVGRPLAGAGEQAEISLRHNGSEVAAGDVGEVCIRGPLVMKEYWNDPEATATVIQDGWFHTGDLGRFDSDGYLYIVD